MAKSKFDRLLAVGLGFENDELATDDGEEIISAAAQPESDMADMAPDVAEIEEASSTAEALTDSTQDLEEVADAIAVSAKAGGISAESAVYARLAIRGIVGRHSMALADAMVPSMESFGGSSARARATTSMEGAIVEALKSFWNAIVAKMKKLFAYVKNWVMKVFGAAPKLKARAEAIAKKAANITGAAEEKTMDLSLVHQLQIENKAPDAAKATAAAKALGKMTAAALGSKTSGQYEGVFTAFETLLDQVDGMTPDKAVKSVAEYYHANYTTTSGPVLLKLTEVVRASSEGLQLATANDATRWGSDMNVSTSAAHPMFGDKMVVVSTSDSKVTLKGGAIDTGFTLARKTRDTHIRITDIAVKPKDIDNSGSFKTLSSSDIRSLCGEVEDMCDSVITYKKSWENREKYFAKMDNAAKKAIANAEKDKDEATIKPRLVKDIALGMSSAMRTGVNYETALMTYTLSVGRALLTWCERSVAQYKSS